MNSFQDGSDLLKVVSIFLFVVAGVTLQSIAQSPIRIDSFNIRVEGLEECSRIYKQDDLFYLSESNNNYLLVYEYREGTLKPVRKIALHHKSGKKWGLTATAFVDILLHQRGILAKHSGFNLNFHDPMTGNATIQINVNSPARDYAFTDEQKRQYREDNFYQHSFVADGNQVFWTLRRINDDIRLGTPEAAAYFKYCDSIYYQSGNKLCLKFTLPQTPKPNPIVTWVTPDGFIGKSDSVLFQISQKGYYSPYNIHTNISIDTVADRLFLNQYASPVIRVYDYQGKYLKSFGEKGKHLTARDSIFLIPKSFVDWMIHLPKSKKQKTKFIPNEQVKKFADLLGLQDTVELNGLFGCLNRLSKDLSVQYLQLYYDHHSGTTYRIYKAPLRDINLKEYVQKITQSYQEVTDQHFTLPQDYFLQIYDPKGQLLQDFPLPSNFSFITVDQEGTVWGFRTKTDHQIVIYKIKPE